jgi:hypothetical protein
MYVYLLQHVLAYVQVSNIYITPVHYVGYPRTLSI